MSFFKERADKAKAVIADAFNKSFGTDKGFIDKAAQNSALEGTPEIVETAHQGVQTSSAFMANHVDVEPVEADAGKYLGVFAEEQPFGTQESLQDSEIDQSESYSVPYALSIICSRIPLPYSFIVRWFHIPNFLTLVLNSLRAARGVGYVRLGFWGQYRKPDVLAQNEPLGRRIIVGWLQWLINNGVGQVKGIVLDGGDAGGVSLDRRDYTISPLKIGTETGIKGTGAAYTSDTAGYALGATAITLITGTGTILDGDEIQFAGDDYIYTVAAGGGIAAPGAITLTEGLKVALPTSAIALTVVTQTAADYDNFDVPVLNAIQELIPMKYRKNLRVIVGEGVYNFLNKDAVSILTTAKGAGTGITESNAMSEYSMKLNIAGFPVVLDETAPANMILVTRTSQSISSYAVEALRAVTGQISNPLLSNSNLVLLRHVRFWRSMVDLAFKSKIVEFTWEEVFYGMRNKEAAVLFHPDSIYLFDGKDYNPPAQRWQLTLDDEPSV